MKNKNLFRAGLIFSLSALLSCGAIGRLSLKGKAVDEVKAETYSGSVFVKLDYTTNWGQKNAKLAVYFWNGYGDGDSLKQDGWSNLVDIGGESLTNVFYQLDYTNLSFQPTKMIVTRQNSTATSPSWANKWNQSVDLDFAKCAWLSGDWDPASSQCGSWNQEANIYSTNGTSGWGKTTSLETFAINSSNHLELSGTVTLEENEEFKIKDHSAGASDGYYSTYNTPEALKSKFSGGGSANIKCLEAGTYTFYFDVVTNSLWITNENIVNADTWAQYFNTNVGCDGTGQTAPTGWGSVKAKYNELITTNEAKDYIYGYTADGSSTADNLARALWNYDWAIKNHPSLDKFIVNSNGTARASSHAASSLININSIGTNVGTGMIAIIVVTILGLTVIGSVVFIKSRKHS